MPSDHAKERRIRALHDCQVFREDIGHFRRLLQKMPCARHVRQGRDVFEDQGEIIRQLAPVDLEALLREVLGKSHQRRTARAVLLLEEVMGEIQGVVRGEIEGLDVVGLKLGRWEGASPGEEVAQGLAVLPARLLQRRDRFFYFFQVLDELC